MTQALDPFDPDEWADRPGCEAFEMAIEMRARAEITPDAVKVLEAHLGACETCRDYVTAGNRVDAALAATTAAPASVNWERARQKIELHIKRYRRTPLTSAVACLAGVALYAGVRLVTGQPVHLSTLVMTLTLFILLVMFAIRPMAERRARRLLEQSDVILAYRGDLEERLSRMRLVVPLFLIMVGMNGMQGIEALPGALAGDRLALSDVLMDGIQVVLMATGTIMSLVMMRRARRELAELNR